MINSFGSNRRRPYLYVGTFVALTLLLILLDSQHAFDPIKSSASGVTASWQQRAQAIGDRLGVARGSVQDATQLRQQLDDVTRQRDQLLVEDSQIADLRRENDTLRKQLDFQTTQPSYLYLPAEVVKNDPESGKKEIILNKGTDDKIAKGMAVTTPEGLMVGVVSDATAHTALVTTIIDQSSHVSAVIQESNLPGTIYGAWQQGKRLLLKNADKDAKIAVGQRIATGNLTNGVMPNLLIGQVYSVNREVVSDSQTIEVLPFADFDKLRAVNVVLGRKS